jgi:hypothetical protein
MQDLAARSPDAKNPAGDPELMGLFQRVSAEPFCSATGPPDNTPVSPFHSPANLSAGSGIAGKVHLMQIAA